jgi:hypothetical protein
MPDQHSDDEVDLDDLDDDFDLIGFREKRMQELAQECASVGGHDASNALGWAGHGGAKT